jgi:hypothetical protein
MSLEFNSQIAMISYFRSLEGADFPALLKDQFGIAAPEDAPKYQSEYLYKYMVQGLNFKHLTGEPLIKYAVDSTENLVRIQPALKTKGLPTVVNKADKPSKTGRTRVVKSHKDGAVFLDHRQVWVGYHGGKIQCTKKTEAAVVEFLAKKFGA